MHERAEAGVPVFADHVPKYLRAASLVRSRDGAYTSTVAMGLGVDTRTARRWLKSATAKGLIIEYAGDGETYWDWDGPDA